MRRRRAEKRPLQPDPLYNNEIAGRFINSLMVGGKKYLAQSIFYDALKIVETKTEGDKTGISIFSQALGNVRPEMEVRSRRVGGATYQVPVEVKSSRKLALAIRWIITAARDRKGMPMAERLAEEILLAADRKGVAYKHREDTHRMAEANRAFAHFRW
jgi:small subunit ribosomal protein S7